MEESPLTCAGCGRELAPDARFCSGCGRPVPPLTDSLWGDADTQILRRAFDRQEQGEWVTGPRMGRHATLTVYRADGVLLFAIEIPNDRPLTIGRGSDQDVRLPDLTVSRAHAVIEKVGHRYTLRDLGSTNATLLNGERIADREVLFDGAEISVGTHILIFREA